MSGETTRHEGPEMGTAAAIESVVVRRSGQRWQVRGWQVRGWQVRGWQVGPEETGDLTSAMVLADLLAADLGAPVPPPAGPVRRTPMTEADEADEAARLAVTVAQLEHALTARVRVEQAIGVLAERHRLRPRQAFDLLRNVSRSRGRKIVDIAETVVDSTSNPLLPLPEELARTQPPPRKRGRSPRHARGTSENVAAER